jgi:hypothetical protein
MGQEHLSEREAFGHRSDLVVAKGHQGGSGPLIPAHLENGAGSRYEARRHVAGTEHPDVHPATRLDLPPSFDWHGYCPHVVRQIRRGATGVEVRLGQHGAGGQRQGQHCAVRGVTYHARRQGGGWERDRPQPGCRRPCRQIFCRAQDDDGHSTPARLGKRDSVLHYRDHPKGGQQHEKRTRTGWYSSPSL